MIVKVARYSGRENYIIIDNIKEIHKIDGYDYSEPLRATDILISDCAERKSIAVGATSDMKPFVMRLNCIKNDGSEIDIIFDTVAYILNDNGKTIERVSANTREVSCSSK